MPNTAASSSADSGLKQKLEGLTKKEDGSLRLPAQGIRREHISLLLSFLDEHQEMTSLDLRYNHIGDVGATELAKNTTLRSLNLLFNEIGDVGATELAKNTTLRSLDLGGNKIGGVGATALAGNTSLTSLGLWANEIGTTGAIALAGNTSLTSLGLVDNHIGDDGAIALAGNTSLRYLGLLVNNIGDVGKSAFEASPAERTSAAREAGANVGLFSLSQLCLFTLKKAGQGGDAMNTIRKECGYPVLADKLEEEMNPNIRL